MYQAMIAEKLIASPRENVMDCFKDLKQRFYEVVALRSSDTEDGYPLYDPNRCISIVKLDR
jgi:hypothetical protein